MVLWDFHARAPKKVFQVPGAPLEIRWAWGENHDYAFTSAALTSKLWLVYEDDRRVVECRLTETGRALVDEIAGQRAASVRATLSVLDPDELAQLHRLLLAMLERNGRSAR